MNYINRKKLLFLFFSQLVVLLPTFKVLPLWLVGFWLVSCIWRFRIYTGALVFPSTLLKSVLAIVGVAGIVFSFQNLFAVEAFVAFFIISFSLKALELHQRSDGLLLVSLGFICLGITFLFYQNIFISLYVILALVMNIQAWVSLYRQRDHSFWKQFRFAFSLVCKALPIMLILFVAMPRFGQLWHMPSQSRTAQTGISDSMSPGEFNQLIQSNAVAFRASFIEARDIPPPEHRYWRAMVFDQFDGQKWQQAQYWPRTNIRTGMPTRQPHPAWKLRYDEGELVRYSVLLEPTQQHWLFALDAPLFAQSESINVRFGNHVTMHSMRKVSARSAYTVTSALAHQQSADGLTPQQLKTNLSIPSRGNNQAREFAAGLRKQFGEGATADRQVLNSVLNFYREQFYYTLQPPVLQGDIIDDFLFKSQRGFCEHFSSSFVFLMRASGMPARVVVGYQGGEVNPLESYLVVRQRDAHAWAEVWLEGEGWTRIDPTSAVAPSRIERGLQDALSDEDRSLVGSGFSTGAMAAWLQLRFDLLSYNWHKWVVSYDNSAQSGFFERFLGGSDAWRIALFFIGGCGVLIAIYFLSAFLPIPLKRHYPESASYARHLRVLARNGFEKRANESPSAFAERISHSEPAWRERLMKIAEVYSAVAYMPPSSKHHAQQLKLLHELCRAWKP